VSWKTELFVEGKYLLPAARLQLQQCPEDCCLFQEFCLLFSKLSWPPL